jgi:DNA-binding transcriptional LysR family regulator
MDIALARTFLAIVASGSFARAAERLHVSQTTVSARVRSLEQQMRRPLFVRGKLGASLTPAGEQFLRYAPALVQLWERARHGVAVPEGRRTVLAVGCEHTLWDPLLVRWLPWMRRTDPAVALRVHIGHSSATVEQVAEGIIDIGVVYAPPYRAGLRVELLAEERLVLVTTPAAAGSSAGDYVQVDWGAQFGMLHATTRTTRNDPDLFVDFGPLGLAYILEAGGSGYFRLSAVCAHLEAGRLRLVPDAPEVVHPAFAVLSESPGDEALIAVALEGLRTALAPQG